MNTILVHGQPCLALALPEGDRALISLHGAQLLSWLTADGVERLYLSPAAVFDGKAAIRGGVPVCFPQFAARGSLPKHGFARHRPWQPVRAQARPGEARAVLRLRDDEETRALWDWPFVATLELRLRPGGLTVGLQIDNPGPRPFSFTTALHTYLRVAALPEAALHGLSGSTYLDSVDGQSRQDAQPALIAAGEVDRIYPRPEGRLRLTGGAGAMHIAQSRSFGDSVVWNPGAALCARIDDLPADGFEHMLCVEAGCITDAAVLPAGDRWRGWQRLSIDPAP